MNPRHPMVRDRFNRVYGGQPVPIGYEEAVLDLMQDQLWTAVVKAFNPKKPKKK